MSLSALDSIDRGVANLRANWELVLLQLAQAAVCSVVAVVGGVGLVFVLGATFLFQLGDLDDWAGVLERLQGLALGGGLLALALAGLFTLATVVGLAYCWFQAGILATLDRGERQAPPIRRLDWQLFRTFRMRDFLGWANEGAWRYFGFFCGLFVLIAVLLAGYGLGVAVLVSGFGLDTAASGLAGCGVLAPLALLAVGLNVFSLLSMALLARPGFGVWRASRIALGILWRRLGALLLLAVLFLIAVVTVAVVFLPLSQGMATALPANGPAWFAVQLLLTLAQWMLHGMLNIALFASAIALVRAEVDGWGR